MDTMTSARFSNSNTGSIDAALRRWALLLPHAAQATLLAGLVVWTIRAALQQRGLEGPAAVILAWVLIGIPTAVDLHHRRVHGRPPQRRSHKWQ
jgi:hypothetical protein